MKVLIIGAGRLGALMAAWLQRGGNEVVLVGRARAVEPARDIAVVARGESFAARVRTVSTIEDSRQDGPYDKILVCVRTLDLATLEKSLREHAHELLSPGGAAISLMNGLGSDDVLAAWFSAHQIVGAIANLAVERDEDGTLRMTTGGDLVVAAFAASGIERASGVAAWLGASGIPCKAGSDLRALRWTKMAWSCAINAITALAQRPMGDLARNPHTRALMLGVVREVMTVAAAEGVTLASALPAVYVRAAMEAGGARSSMLQDTLSARSTEHAALNGAICALAKQHDLSVPLNEALFALLDARTDPSVGKELP